MAYTKYSLTPANNNAAPPDGAPEGMLPSAVNDTMRDMMAQIRDVGDGIRGGTYTMTAPVITGGSVTGATGSFSTLAASGVATFSAGTVSAPAITTTGDTNTGIFFPAADTIAFTEGGAESMRIDSSGNVCVGSTAAGNAGTLNVSVGLAGTTAGGIQLWSNTTAAHSIQWGDGTSSTDPYRGYIEYAHNGDSMRFGTQATERMRIDSSGNVGIGVSSIINPGGSRRGLQISNGTSGGIISLSSDGSESNNPRIFGSVSTQYDLGLAAGSSTGFIASYTNGTERMRIESGGALLVTTARSSARGRVDIPDTGGTQGVVLAISRGGDAGTMVNFYSTNSTTTTIGTIGNSGNTNTTYNTSSDYRLKENIAPMTGALGAVSALKPVTWKWKSTGANGQGFIAHELAEVVPDCVTGEKDAVDSEGNPEYQGIDTSYLVATLTAAIQELKAELDSVKAELQTIKGA